MNSPAATESHGTAANNGLLLAHAGSYPRIGDTPDLQLLRRTIAAADRGEAAAADLRAAEDEITRRALADQALAGIDLITDGMIRWYDPVSHVPGKLQGVEVRGLLRFFDTNFYFRQPAFVATPLRRAPILAEEYMFARDALRRFSSPSSSNNVQIKQVLTGPYTLARFSLSENGTLQNLGDRAAACAEILVSEIEDLAAAGAGWIQIDEPAILKYPADWPVLEAALAPLLEARDRMVKSGKPLKLALYVYFRDCVPLYDQLIGLPFDLVGLDFTYNWRLIDVVAQRGSPRPLALGLLDGRNTRLEDPSAVARQIENMLPKIAGQAAHLGPSCGLEYLPRDRAQSKLRLLSQVRSAFLGAASSAGPGGS